MSEKEYGTFGPAVVANRFVVNPVHYMEGKDKESSQENSRYVNELMDGVGYSYKMIKYRQAMWAEVSKLYNSHATSPYTQVTTGGKGEGTTLFFESDIDIMFVLKDVICADIPKYFKHQKNSMLFKTETQETSPGYTRLKLFRRGRILYEALMSSLFTAETGSSYLSSLFFSDALKVSQRAQLGEGITAEPTSGPSNPTTDKYLSSDNVVCFSCFCPNIVERWVARRRSKGWPSPETIHIISRLEGHVVPVGLKESPNKYREWRICYSLAELHLMQILNEPQLKVYIILKKICKSVLKPICKDMTSYIMKNVLLWMCEIKGLRSFTRELTLDRLCDCIQYLKKCVCKNNLPSYMITERNLLPGRLDIEQKQELLSALCNLLKERGRMLLRCEKFRDAMIEMYKTPNTFKEKSDKRDEVEILCLRTRRIMAETDRPEMSRDELRERLLQNKLYLDMDKHIENLIQFDVQELKQMGKTGEEINDLWNTKLSQFLS